MLLRLGVSQIPPAASENPIESPPAALHPQAGALRSADRRCAATRARASAPAQARAAHRRRQAVNALDLAPATAARSPQGARRSWTAARPPPESRESFPGRELKPAPAATAAAHVEPHQESSASAPTPLPASGAIRSCCPAAASPPAYPAAHAHVCESARQDAFQSQLSGPPPSSPPPAPAPPDPAESPAPARRTPAP